MAAFLILLLNLMFLQSTAQQISSNISLGSSLSPANNSYLSSASGHFAFGFYRKGEGYAVGIWLAKIQQKTVIWTANRDDPPLSRDAVLIFGTDGRLVLQQQGGEQTIISNISQPASSASMLNSGNFVLYNSDSEIIWQSFDSPTDTILPGQSLRPGSQLVSSMSETDHSSGKFFIIMEKEGNLVQYPMPSVIYPLKSEYSYWDSGTYTAGNNVTLGLESMGWLFLKNRHGIIVSNLTNQLGNGFGRAMYRATIDADGVFRLYSHSLDQNDHWFIQWTPFSDRCDPLGLCGLNGYCTSVAGDDPVCLCPPGFDFNDQKRRNLGCMRNSSLDGCISDSKSFSIEKMDDMYWADDPYTTVPSPDPTACQEECLRDCNCEIALYSNQHCRKQKLPLKLGRTQGRRPVTAFFKVKNGDSRRKVEGRKTRKVPRMAVLLVSIVLLIASSTIVSAFYIFFYRYRIWRSGRISYQRNDELQLLGDVTLRSFSYQELQNATRNFTTEIGRGAFGTVFKGISGSKVIAIKRLERVVAENDREFQNEMKAIGRTHHRNLVRLLGYCHDGTNRLLVYEFMVNGSLSNFLFKPEQKPSWEERTDIALKIARGIVYLHEECETQIIHCDIKPENILMDENNCPKIADFGLSKLMMADQSRTYTGIRGTRGYVAPEWHKNSPITAKVDVYSFGIMLLEIICCRKRLDVDAPKDEIILAIWAYDCFEANELNKLVREGEVESSELERMVKVALWCIQDEPALRPSMKKVVMMLEGSTDIPAPPSPSPSFVSSLS